MDSKSRVIVIGTSAGGLDALFRIVPNLAPDLAAPVLVVQHIGAHPSELPALLSGRGPLPAVFAEEGIRPQAGTIYVGRIQPVDATVWLNISAGVWKPSVFLGLSFNCLAKPLSFACE